MHKTPSTCDCEPTRATLEVTLPPPRQPTLHYRLGTHGEFLQRMLERLCGPETVLADGRRPLAALTTRSPDDPAIALIDAWAVVADILCFYQERIADEGFLRTAGERRSVLELARSIGYELAPGLSASAWLAFTADTTRGAPAATVIPRGTQVQSIPGQGQTAQTFETSREITARPEWNALHPRLTAPPDLGIHEETLRWLEFGGSTSVDDISFISSAPGGVTTFTTHDVSSLWLVSTGSGLRPGDRILCTGAKGVNAASDRVIPRITAVREDHATSRTEISIEPPTRPSTPLTPPITLIVPTDFRFATILAGRYTGEALLRQRFGLKHNEWLTLREFQSVARRQDASRTQPPHRNAARGIFGFRTRVGVFGHNAPPHEILEASELGAIAAPDNTAAVVTGTLNLERVVPEILAGDWVLLEHDGTCEAFVVQAIEELAVAEFGISARVTRLHFKPDASPSDQYKIRETTVHVQSVALTPAPREQTAPLDATSAANPWIELEEPDVGLVAGQALIVSGETTDTGLTRSELAIVRSVRLPGDHPVVELEHPLTHKYVRSTVQIQANVAPASHGQTVREVLGSGDAAAGNQRFRLARPPLTFLSSASAPGGRASTLELRVADVLWPERLALHDLAPDEPGYELRIADDGTTTVTFGDGRHGATLPSGQHNVVATYRSGLGADGNVPAGALSLLMTRPLGVTAVTNPFPALGGEAPERLVDARRNAPVTVRTFDRLVSRSDYEDFARTFAGIDKARAGILSRGERSWVHLTIAAHDGVALDDDDELFVNLAEALRRHQVPSHIVQLASYRRVDVHLALEIVVDTPRYVAALVESAVRAALADDLGFAARELGQPLTSAEIVARAHAVRGVLGARVMALATEPPSPGAAPPAFLRAAVATWSAGAATPAELLVLHPDGARITTTSQEPPP